jgi:hypothetical protein
MLKLDNVKMALENAAKEIVRQAKINLGATQTIMQNDGKMRRKQIDASGNLSRSLKYSDITNKDGNLSIDILMDFYGPFIDQGVDGTRNKTPNRTPFSFKNEGVGVGMQYSIFEWMRAKRFRIRDLSTGRFKKGKVTSKSYENLAYVIARSIKRKGINQTYFITTPFNLTTSQLPDVLEKALGADIEAYLLSLNQVK